MTPRGRRRHLVTIQSPTGTPAANGDGGFTQNFTTIATVRASIESVTAQNFQRSLERLVGGAVISQATHTIGLPYTASVAALTLQSKIVTVVTQRTYNVLGVINPDELNRELIVTASEVVA